MTKKTICCSFKEIVSTCFKIKAQIYLSEHTYLGYPSQLGRVYNRVSPLSLRGPRAYYGTDAVRRKAAVIAVTMAVVVCGSVAKGRVKRARSVLALAAALYEGVSECEAS